MALIKSTLLAQISGSIAGTTFSHNRGGSYARSRALVSNPQTTRQSEVRTALTSLSTMWRDSLTEAQRASWNAFGGSTTVINRVGDSISLSGIAAFNRLNLFRVATLDEEPILDPPPSADLPPGTVVPAYVSASLGNPVPQTLTVELTAAATTYFGLAIYYSAPISPGIRYFRGPYAGRVIDNAPVSASVSIDMPNIPQTAGYHVAFRITLFDVTSGLPIWTVYQEPLVTEDP